MAKRRRKTAQTSRDVASSRSASWERSGARDRGGRQTASRVWTQDNGRARASKSACRDRSRWD